MVQRAVSWPIESTALTQLKVSGSGANQRANRCCCRIWLSGMRERLAGSYWIIRETHQAQTGGMLSIYRLCPCLDQVFVVDLRLHKTSHPWWTGAGSASAAIAQDVGSHHGEHLWSGQGGQRSSTRGAHSDQEHHRWEGARFGQGKVEGGSTFFERASRALITILSEVQSTDKAGDDDPLSIVVNILNKQLGKGELYGCEKAYAVGGRMTR
jgi:hypothetical protein